MNTSTVSKYAPALIPLAIVLVGALAQLTGHITLIDALQLIPLAGNALLIYLVPLFGTAARSGWKTGVAVLGALITAGIPYAATGHITGSQIAIVILAGLQALGAHIGVQIRNDAATFAVSSTGVVTPAGAAAGEPPTATTVQKAITTNGGQFLGDAAR
ncbi:MAG: hypothetical protein HIU88_10290 [Acidobacteria bacterium]|nr:hypothetical protein [Acidobacteriota bacterium]